MKRLLVAAIALFVLAACTPKLTITAPGVGSIVPAGNLTVAGQIPSAFAKGGTLTVNGVPTSYGADGKWSLDVGVSGPDGTVRVVEAIYTEPNGTAHRQRSAVVVGPGLAEFQFSPDGVGMNFTNTALTNLGPVINGLAGGSFDISGLILAQDPLIDTTLSGIHVTGKAYEAGAGGVSLAVASAAGGVNVDVSISDLYLGLNLNLGILGDCKLEVVVPSTTVLAKFDLKPQAGAESFVDVNMIGAPTVNTANVDYEFISGVCDPSSPIIGSIVNSLAGGSIPGTIGDGFSTQLADPDGTGPADSPIADAIETALAEISIAGSVGDAVQAEPIAPFTQINETANSIDFRANADFRAAIGTGPGQCQQVPGSPLIANTYNTPGTYPTLGGTTPSGQPYGLGLVISASAFNQLLASMTTCGLLNQEVTEFALGGNMLPITSSLLGALIPAFATAIPANTPMFVEVDPNFSPFLSGKTGPAGEMAELTLADLQLRFIQPTANGNVNWLTLAVDAPLGFEMGYDASAGALAPTISPPPAGTVTVRVVDNKVGANEPAVESVFASLFPSFVSGLADSFAAFPLPAFLGLDLAVSEFAREGNSFVLYADLNLAPKSHIANVTLTDTSPADFAVDSAAFDSHEWRHRVRKQITDSSVNVQLKGMIGADACCTVEDERARATPGGRVAFDVVGVGGESWRVDLNHMIKGAHTLISEGVGGGFGADAWMTPVTGRYRIGTGAWVNFNFSPDNLGTGWNRGGVNVPFQGSAATSFTGSGSQSVTVEYNFAVEVLSDSQWAFPAEAGNEAAIRFGVNDSLTNNFTAGDYPGVGNRNVADDGYSLSISLTPLG